MSELILWKNREMDKLRRDMDRLFNRFWPDIGADLFLGEVSASISIDTVSTDNAFIIKASLPGIDPESLKISVAEDKLTIKGCRREEAVGEGGYYQKVERRLRSFSRTVIIPFRVNIDKIKATFNNGILNVVVPKWSPKKAHYIRIELG